MNKEKHRKLILQKEEIERDINKIATNITKACSHEVTYAYYRPYFCEKCSIDYIKYCLSKNLSFPNIDAYLTAEKHIKEEVKFKKYIKLIKQRAVSKAKRKHKINNCIQDYRNKNIIRSKEEIGKRYERQIGYIYESIGWNVEYHGIYYGVKDGGIDLIAKSKKVHHVIQCKNYSDKHEIHLNTIQQFAGVVGTYKREHKNNKVYGILFTSHANLDEESKKEIAIANIFDHQVQPYVVDYPLIKCKKESMIYHLPCNANYDRIKINIKRGDMYIEAEDEAIKLGYRPANN